MAPATVQFAFANESLLESAGTFTVPVTLSSASTTAVRVPFTLAGSAVNGIDYSNVTYSPLMIPAGQTVVNITGTLLDDGVPDAVKTLSFDLGTPTGAALGDPTLNTLTMAEPSANMTTLSIANSSAKPSPTGSVTMNFTVTRQGDLTSQLTVGYTTVAGTAQPTTDFTPMTGVVTFASGSATATIGIPISANTASNTSNLTFSVILTGVVDEVGPPVTFATQTTFATGAAPFFAAMADVNGDGRADVVVTNNTDNTVSVLLNTTNPGATTPSFAAQQTFATGNSPRGVAVADVNGDGKLDLLVDNLGDGSVTVLLNTTPPGAANVSFQPQQTFPTGRGPFAVAAADVNGDGMPDIIVANISDGTVSVLLNTTAAGATTPSFANQQTFTTGSGPFAVAMGDVNGDGRPDLVVTDNNDKTVSVLLNVTAPGAAVPAFGPQQTFATGGSPASVVIADVNGDGRPDLVVANNADGTVSVLLNTIAPGATTPAFASQQTFATGRGPLIMDAGDVNGDGRPDLRVTDFGDSTVSLLLNTTAPGATTASFAAQQTFATGRGTLAVAAGDVNGDGEPDLVVTNRTDSTVSVLLNKTMLGAATVVPGFRQTTYGTGHGPQGMAAGDTNGDGKPDLVASNFSDNTLSVLLNTTKPGSTAPTFAGQQTFATGLGPQSVRVADVNGDGRPDLVVANVAGNTISVLLNTTAPGATTPAFAGQQTFATGRSGDFVEAGDVNGDGRPDLVVGDVNDQAVSVLLNTTAPGATTLTFAGQQTFAVGTGPFAAALADVNGDGKLDLIVANQIDNTLSVLLNTTAPGATTPSFAQQQTFATGAQPRAVVAGDVNGDGRPDLIVANVAGNTISVLLNTTAPGATTPAFAGQQTFPTGQAPQSLALADVNGDGKADVVVANDNTASVLLNATAPGATTPAFASQQTFATGLGPQLVSPADVNGDGRPDLLVANAGDNTLSVLANAPVTILGDTATGTIIGSLPPGFFYDHGSMVLTVTGTNFTFAQATTANSVSVHTLYTFTLDGASVSFADTALSQVIALGQGASATAILITNDTYVDMGGMRQETQESISLGSMTDAGVGTMVKPGSTGPVTFLTLSYFPTSYAYVGRNDGTVQLNSTAGVPYDGFVSAGNYAYVGGIGLFHLAQGATSVYGYSANQPTDFAFHYAANPGSAFVVSGTAFSYMSGMDTAAGVTQSFFNVGVGFLQNTGVARNPGQDFAYIIDSPRNDTFVGGDAFSFMFIPGPPFAEFDAAYGFALVFAQSFVGGVDTASNNAPNRNILAGFRVA